MHILRKSIWRNLNIQINRVIMLEFIVKYDLILFFDFLINLMI